MTTSTRSAGMAVIRVAAVAISPAKCVLGVGAECRFSDGVSADRHGCYFFGLVESSCHSALRHFSGCLDVLGDNDLFVLMC